VKCNLESNQTIRVAIEAIFQEIQAENRVPITNIDQRPTLQQRGNHPNYELSYIIMLVYDAKFNLESNQTIPVAIEAIFQEIQAENRVPITNIDQRPTLQQRGNHPNYELSYIIMLVYDAKFNLESNKSIPVAIEAIFQEIQAENRFHLTYIDLCRTLQQRSIHPNYELN
jgi:hypothetical protein